MAADFGTDPRLLHRTGDPDTSEAAAHAVDSAGLEELVYRDIVAAGERGATQDEILAKHDRHPYSSITARFAALLRKGMIYDTGMRRPGRSGRSQRVVRAKEN